MQLWFQAFNDRNDGLGEEKKSPSVDKDQAGPYEALKVLVDSGPRKTIRDIA